MFLEKVAKLMIKVGCVMSGLPQIDNRAICIAGEDVELASVISSYFLIPGKYFAIFKFPDVAAFSSEADDFNDDEFISKVIGDQARALIGNAISRLHPDKIIFAGLSDKQKSFLSQWPRKNIIEIDKLEEIEGKLNFISKRFSGEVCYSRANITEQFIYAAQNNLKLIHGSIKNQKIHSGKNKRKGIVVIEDKFDLSTVIAINYGIAIDADIVLTDPFSKNEANAIPRHIHEWKKNKNKRSHRKLAGWVNNRIRDIDFRRYKYATFFTDGLPYGLILQNIIPITHIWRGLREGLFIFNNLHYEIADFFNSAIVFSPEEFMDEETEGLITELDRNNFFVKPLIGQDATVRNFSDYIEHYPYDLLHICSHGGETDGYYVIDKFKDRRKKKHTVEYEEIVGFSPVPGKGLIEVVRKVIYRKFDGFYWMTPELERQNIPRYVFEDMRKSIFKGDMSKNALRVKANYNIPMSCHVKCYDSIHQGQVNILACHNSPFIFNNTCSSWREIAKHFIASGCRGYVGTLWPIKNNIAKNAADCFYNRIFSGTILNAFYDMCSKIKGSVDSNIYIYWGTHFSSLRRSSKKTKAKVSQEIYQSFFRWLKHIRDAKNETVKKNSVYILNFTYKQLLDFFDPADLTKIHRKIKNLGPGQRSSSRENCSIRREVIKKN